MGLLDAQDLDDQNPLLLYYGSLVYKNLIKEAQRSYSQIEEQTLETCREWENELLEMGTDKRRLTTRFD